MSEKRMAAMAEKMNLQDAVDEYCTMLRRRELDGSLPCAKKTAEILRLLITTQRHTDANALIDDIRNHGYRMQAAKPVELAIGNVVRRVLHIVREEAKQEELTEQQNMQPEVQPEVQKAAEPAKPQIGLLAQALRSHSTRFVLPRGVSLSNLLDVGIEDIDALAANRPNLSASGAGAAALAAAAAAAADRMEVASEASTKQKRLKQAAQWPGKHEVIDAINELIDELDTIQNSITLQGVEYIHANEVILTFGMSDTTFYFLKEASKKREFQVVVAEGAPRFDGHIMARKLSDAGIQTTVIADSAVFAMMARANKVLVGAHAVLANGGVIAPVGIHMVALAAKRHSIPFVVLVGLHKLSPLFPHDPDLAYNDFKSPSAIIDFAVLAEAFSQQEALAHSLVAEPGAAPPRTFGFEGGNVHVPNPSFDYVPPHLISLFVTDMGGHTPSYVYRLLTEYYSREDYLLSKELFPSAR